MRAACWCTLAAASFPAAAAFCKYTDTEGRTLYTNVAPERGWKKVMCEGETAKSPAPVSSGSSKAPTPANFPRVDASTQRGRDDVRRRVLTEELASEERLLMEARAAYANGAPPREPDEQVNPQKYGDRVARLRQSLSLHEKNVDALRKELASLK